MRKITETQMGALAWLAAGKPDMPSRPSGQREVRFTAKTWDVLKAEGLTEFREGRGTRVTEKGLRLLSTR